MNFEPGTWNKLTRAIMFLLIVAGGIAVGVWYYPLFVRQHSLRVKVMEIERDIRKEEDETRRLRSSIDAASKDPRTIERLARERLGYARAGETVFRFESAPAQRQNEPARIPPRYGTP